MKIKNKNFLVAFLSIIVFFMVIFLKQYFISIDKIIIYDYLKTKNELTHFKASDNIVVIEIDERSLKEIGTYPFSRNIYAKVFENLKNKGASIVGLDVILSNTGADIVVDNKLAKTIKKTGNIVLGAGIYNGNFLELPLEKFRKNALGVGFFNPKINRRTNTVYSFYPKLKLRGDTTNKKEFFNIFGIEIIKNYLKIKKIEDKNSYLNLGNIKIPYARNNSKEVLINYLSQNKFKNHISISDVYFKNGEFNKLNFKNKIVLIGATAQGLKDIFNTPNGIDFGIYIHANILNTILSGKFLIYFNKILEYGLIFLLIFIAIYFNFSKNNRTIIFSNLAILFIFIFLPYLILFPTNLILNYPFSIIIAFILSITISNVVKYLLESKDRKKMTKALGEYISKDIANSILNGDGDIKLDGENKKISIFFSDIAGFTTISEKMNPEELVEFLREYLGAMSNIIMDEHGFINKYEGDAIMALFGVFKYEKNSTFDNCISAIKQQQLLNIMNNKWQEKFGETLSVRMGIHTGNAIIGNIGAKGRKMEYTALGDSVNLASRLEGINKFYNTKICISEDAYLEVKDKFEFRKLDKIKVKGKDKAIVIYELLDLKGKISDIKKGIIINFEKALELYFKGEFQKASFIFQKLSQLGDKPSLIFTRRCLQIEIKLEKKDIKSWDGIWKFDEK